MRSTCLCAQHPQVSRSRGVYLACTSQEQDVPVLMWTHSDRNNDRVRGSKGGVRGVREGEGFRFRQPSLSIAVSRSGLVGGSSAARTFDDGVGTLTEGLQYSMCRVADAGRDRGVRSSADDDHHDES